MSDPLRAIDRALRLGDAPKPPGKYAAFWPAVKKGATEGLTVAHIYDVLVGAGHKVPGTRRQFTNAMHQRMKRSREE